MKLPWRSASLASFLWRLDNIAAENRNPRVRHRRNRGNAPRAQYHPSQTTVKEDAKAPPGLPINCYDNTWYNSLRDAEIEDLCADQWEYDFSFLTKGKDREKAQGAYDDEDNGRDADDEADT